MIVSNVPLSAESVRKKHTPDKAEGSALQSIGRFPNLKGHLYLFPGECETKKNLTMYKTFYMLPPILGGEGNR